MPRHFTTGCRSAGGPRQPFGREGFIENAVGFEHRGGVLFIGRDGLTHCSSRRSPGGKGSRGYSHGYQIYKLRTEGEIACLKKAYKEDVRTGAPG